MIDLITLVTIPSSSPQAIIIAMKRATKNASFYVCHNLPDQGLLLSMHKLNSRAEFIPLFSNIYPPKISKWKKIIYASNGLLCMCSNHHNHGTPS